MKRSLFILCVLVLIALAKIGVVAPADATSPPQYVVDESSLPFDALPGHEDATRLWGVHAGAGYRIEVPAAWNGDLVMWAHGLGGRIGNPQLFLEPVEDFALRQTVLDMGYAWAASTYSKNDYNVSQAVIDTHALATRFHGLVGNPDRIFITGRSMGGHITGVSVEQYPSFYAGALPLCALLGGFESLDSGLDFNLAAQQIALGSAAWPIDSDTYLTHTALLIKANLEAVPGGWPVALNADGEAFRQLVELRTGGVRPNFDEAWFFWNSFPHFGSGIPGNFLFDAVPVLLGALPSDLWTIVDNTDVIYQTDTDPALSPYEQALNEAILRVAADPAARQNNGLPNVKIPPVTGDISVPVLTLHNLGDMVAPFLNQVIYAGEVAAHGQSELLVQRAIRGVNHCGFTQSELETAFIDLTTWVETGVRPAGDDAGDPAAVAADDFGCQFTDFAGGHLFPAPCP